MLAAEVSAAAEDDQRHEEDGVGHVVRPRIMLYKFLGIVDEGEDGDEGERDQELHCENHEDLVGEKGPDFKQGGSYKAKHSLDLTQVGKKGPTFRMKACLMVLSSKPELLNSSLS